MDTIAIQNLISKTPRELIKGGCCAKFVPINEDWGFKYYFGKNVRDQNYYMQEQSEYGPALGDKLEFHLNGKMVYGFITENVNVCGEAFDKQWYKNNPHLKKGEIWSQYEHARYWSELLDFYENQEPWASANSELNNEEWNDRHAWNWGITKSGRTVMIDFSAEHYKFGIDEEYDD